MRDPSSPDPLAPRIRRLLGILPVVISSAALPACDDPNAVEAIRVVGALDDKQVQIPDTMTAGVPSEIALWTNISGCWTGGETEVAITGRSALVIPYDYQDFGAPQCGTHAIVSFKHTTNVVFDDPGTAEITIAYSHDGRYLRRYGFKVYTVEVTQ